MYMYMYVCVHVCVSVECCAALRACMLHVLDATPPSFLWTTAVECIKTKKVKGYKGTRHDGKRAKVQKGKRVKG